MLGKSTHDPRTEASICHKYAVFSDRQYHAILQSPDAFRWKVYVQRKTQEIERREQELRRTQSAVLQDSLKVDQSRARKLLEEDSELFQKHNLARDTFLKQAIDMYSRCLESSDDFDNEAVIRLCSLWFANFDEETRLHEEIGRALDRIPSRKMLFLAVSSPISFCRDGCLTQFIAPACRSSLETTNWRLAAQSGQPTASHSTHV